MDRAAQKGPCRALLGGYCAQLTAHAPRHYDERVTKKALTPTYLWPCAQLLAILGGQFRVGDEICGCVLSIRYQEDILSVWNKSADSRRVCMQIRDTMRSVMSLPESATMECKQRCSKTRAASCPLHPIPAPRRMLTRLSPTSNPHRPSCADKKHTDSMRDNSSYRNTNANF